MKPIPVIYIGALSLCLSSKAFGQTSFQFRNYSSVNNIDAPVFNAEGAPLEGSNYLVELWGGATATSLTPALELDSGATRLIIPFGQSGYFFSSAGFLSVPAETLGGGGWAWLEVRAWDARLGTTYEHVSALGIGGYGESPLFYAHGGNPLLALPEAPAPLVGLQSFSLRPVVPEPSTWALLALGGAAIGWALRRRQQNRKKQLMTLAAILAFSGSAFGQGQVLLGNNSSSLVRVGNATDGTPMADHSVPPAEVGTGPRDRIFSS